MDVCQIFIFYWWRVLFVVLKNHWSWETVLVTKLWLCYKNKTNKKTIKWIVFKQNRNITSMILSMPREWCFFFIFKENCLRGRFWFWQQRMMLNIFALIDQKLPLKILSRCAHYILLATYFVWLLKPFKESFRFFSKGFFSTVCYLLMPQVTCHLSYVTFQMSPITCHL